MDNDTYIRLYRSLLNWDYYRDRNVKDVYIHCLLSANFKEKNWKGEKIERGSFVTTYKKMSEELGMTPQEVRTALNKLIDSNNITKKITNKYTVISVVGYDVRQNSDVEVTNKLTSKIANKKEPVKVKEVKNEPVIKPSIKGPVEVHYITERLLNNNLIDSSELLLFDEIIQDALSSYEAVDVVIKSEYVLKLMLNKSCNRLAYFKSALFTNLDKDYKDKKKETKEVSNDVNVNMDELDEFLSQFE